MLTEVEQSVRSVILSGTPWLEAYGLWAVFLGLLTETLMFTGIFVPGYGILFAAGFLIAARAMPLWPVLAAAWGGAVLGDQLSYVVGHYLGRRLLRKRRTMAEGVETALSHQAPLLLLSYHYSPLFRPLLPCVAGMARLRRGTWLLFDSLGVVLWVAAVLTLGYTSHGALVGTSGALMQASNALVTLLVLWITWRIKNSLATSNTPVRSRRPTPDRTRRGTV